MTVTPLQDLKLTPNFNHTCVTCRCGPTVLLAKDGQVVHDSQICGACYFGCADMADPEEWAGQ